MVFNLLSNSIKYSGRETPRITIEAEHIGRSYVVKDCGIGIDEDEKEQVFGLGFRGRRATQNFNVSGQGIGLYVARNVVEAHGGSIEVRGTGQPICIEIALPEQLSQRGNLNKAIQ